MRDSANTPYLSTAKTTGDFVLPFDLSYELDVWGRVRRTVTASREEAQATAGDLATVSLSLHAELAYDYFELRSADAQKKPSRRNREDLSGRFAAHRESLRRGRRSEVRRCAGANATRSHDRARYGCCRATGAVRTCHCHTDRQAAGGVQPASIAAQFGASGYLCRVAVTTSGAAAGHRGCRASGRRSQ